MTLHSQDLQTPFNLYIVNTLDGHLYGIDKQTGQQLWSIKSDPMLQVSQIPSPNSLFSLKDKDSTTFIPEISGDSGNLFYYDGESGEMKRLGIPMKQIINEHSIFIHDKYVFTGLKWTLVMAIDPKNGKILKTFGSQKDDLLSNGDSTLADMNDALYIGRVYYNLNIWDKQSSALKWNITFSEFIPQSTLDESLQSQYATKEFQKDSFKVEIQSQSDGGLVLQDKKSKNQIEMHLGSPLLGILDVTRTQVGFYSIRKSIQQSTDLTYVGEMSGSLYVLPNSKHDLLASGSNAPLISQNSVSLDFIKCHVGSPIFPSCLVGYYNTPKLITSGSGYLNFNFTVLFSLFFASLLLFWFLKVSRLSRKLSSKNQESQVNQENQENEEKQEKGLKSIQLTDTILGTGSHGTIVYLGYFESRKVAVKRLLLEFHDLANHEVKILQESDFHPNVIRYYYKELHQGFMYLVLELCPASLYDVMEDVKFQNLKQNFNSKIAIHQMLSGIHHLHNLKIVHRDIKPQNILIAETVKNQSQPRLLISDFGLGKRLEDGHSFFHVSHATAGGTCGWRAPESILATQKSFIHSYDSSDTIHSNDKSNNPSLDSSSLDKSIRISKAVDAFSAGCVAFYILTNGSHPFGNKMNRESNILKGNSHLEVLNQVQDGYLARDLIKNLIHSNPSKRLEMSRALIHPYFWSSSTRLSFLQDFSDRIEGESRDPPTSLLQLLEKKCKKVLGCDDWTLVLDAGLLDTLSKYRKYDKSTIQDLLRVIRNKKHHYSELPLDVQERIGSLPDGYLAYFMNLFPNLFAHVYHVVADSPILMREAIFKPYFSFQSSSLHV